MKRTIFVYVVLAATAAADWERSRQASRTPTQGTSNPPPDDTITTPSPRSLRPTAKPSPSHTA